MKKFLKWLVILISLFLVYIFFIEPNLVLITRINIESEKISKDMGEIKILEISDLHIKNFGVREREVLFLIRAIKPDVIFITGDFYEKLDKLSEVKKFISGLKLKTYAVLGNWDYWAGDIDPLINMLERNKIEVLINDNRLYFKNGDFINIVGVSDPYTGHDDIERATMGINKKKFTILLSHAPCIVNHLKGEKFDLIICGHTHGGQVNIPFVKPFWAPTETNYIRGMYETKWGKLYVNRGIGLSVFPIRFLCPPEITLFTLKSKE